MPNLNTLLSIVKSFAPKYFSQIETAISKAREAMQHIDMNNPVQGLKQLGVNKSFLQGLKNTSNPIASYIVIPHMFGQRGGVKDMRLTKMTSFTRSLWTGALNRRPRF